MKLPSLSRATLITLILLLVGVCAWYISHVPAGRLASIFHIAQNTHITPEPTVSPAPLSGDVSAWSLATVSVQTFVGATMVQKGTGTVISSDGLIVTTNAAAPFASGSAIYQITTARGAVVRARRVAFDAPSGLVLLKMVGTTDPVSAVQFTDEAVQAGDTLTIVAAVTTLSHYTPVIVPASVVYTDTNGRVPALSLDRSFLALLLGGRVVDDAGNTIGILRPTAPAGIISAATIEAFITRYLAAPPAHA